MPRRVFRSDPVCHFFPVSKAESKSLIRFPNLPASRSASRLSMEESSSSSSSSSSSTTPLYPLSYWDCLNLFLLRPSLAISFVFSFILLGWFLAWKLVLVHVPLVQEIFGLRKKSVKPKPPNSHRLSKFYSSMNRDTQQHSDSNKPI